jgi:hypothetical protein
LRLRSMSSVSAETELKRVMPMRRSPPGGGVDESHDDEEGPEPVGLDGDGVETEYHESGEDCRLLRFVEGPRVVSP